MVTHKSRRIEELVEPFSGRTLDARYLGYFDCFNRRLFFEAHEVLEDLWLLGRAGRNGAFHKGLIQLAGAFVHLQKGRLRPAAALFRLSRENLRGYGPVHEHLDVRRVLGMISEFLRQLEQSGFEINPLGGGTGPRLDLEGGNGVVEGSGPAAANASELGYCGGAIGSGTL